MPDGVAVEVFGASALWIRSQQFQHNHLPRNGLSGSKSPHFSHNLIGMLNLMVELCAHRRPFPSRIGMPLPAAACFCLVSQAQSQRWLHRTSSSIRDLLRLLVGTALSADGAHVILVQINPVRCNRRSVSVDRSAPGSETSCSAASVCCRMNSAKDDLVVIHCRPTFTQDNLMTLPPTLTPLVRQRHNVHGAGLDGSGRQARDNVRS